MHKYDCRDCACLVKREGGSWQCTILDKPTVEINECPDGMEALRVGDHVVLRVTDEVVAIMEILGEDSFYIKHIRGGITKKVDHSEIKN